MKLRSLMSAGLASAFALLLTVTTVHAAQPFNLENNIVNKLLAAKDKMKSPGAGYTLQSVAYTGSFVSKPMRFEETTTVPQPLSSQSTYVAACYPAKYSLKAEVSTTTTSGETFSSDEVLSTDTTVTVSGSYATVNVEAVANIKTSQSKYSSVTTQQVAASKNTATATKSVTCASSDQPVFFSAVGTANKNLWVNTRDGSSNINYRFDTYPTINSNNRDWTSAPYTATWLKPGTTSWGSNLRILIYNTKGANSGIFDRAASGDPAMQWYNGNTDGWFGNNPDSASITLSYGGNNATVILRNKKGAEWTVTGGFNNRITIPSGWAKDNLDQIIASNADRVSTPSQTTVVTGKLSDVLTYADVVHTTTGSYNASSMQDVQLNVTYNMQRYEDLLRAGGNGDILKQCDPNLKAAKERWAKLCVGSGVLNNKALTILLK
jgi:hypothetical protein